MLTARKLEERLARGGHHQGRFAIDLDVDRPALGVPREWYQRGCVHVPRLCEAAAAVAEGQAEVRGPGASRLLRVVVEYWATRRAVEGPSSPRLEQVGNVLGIERGLRSHYVREQKQRGHQRERREENPSGLVHVARSRSVAFCARGQCQGQIVSCPHTATWP